MKNLLISFLLCLTICETLMAQGADSSWKHIGVQDGLSNGFVLDMTVDARGFVWVATEAGLSKVAVNGITSYRKANSPLASNELSSVYYDKRGDVLWIATRQHGINRLDCHTQQMDTLTVHNGLLSNSVCDLTEAEDGGVWILHTSGEVQHFDTRKRTFVNYTRANTPGMETGGRTCTDDKNGHLYIGHIDNGMSVLDIRTRSVKRFRYRQDNPAGIPGNNVRSICMDHLKNIWVGTNHGIGLFNPLNGTFSTFRHREADDASLVGDNVFCIAEMNGKELWIASDYGGISILDLTTWQEAQTAQPRFIHITPVQGRLSSPNVRALLQDSFGNVWVGSYCTGVDFVSRHRADFHLLPYYDVAEDGHHQLRRVYGLASGNHGGLWLGGENSLAFYQGQGNVRTWDVSPYLKRTASVVYIVHQDREGKVWMGMNDEGVICYDPQHNTFSHPDLGKDYLDIHAFYEDKQGRMWIGSEAGVFSSFGGEVIREKKINHLMRNSTIYALMGDEDASLWVGTLGGGVYLFDARRNLKRHLTVGSGLPSNFINQIYRDAEGGLWIATYEGLAYIKDVHSPEKIEVYNEKQGLKDSHVRAVTEDRMGNIWVSTYTGIACWNRHRQQFARYDHHEGVPQGGFVESAAASLPDGRVAFASPEGVCLFNPQLLTAPRGVSPIQLTASSLVTDQSREYVPRVWVPDARNTIRLPYNRNSFRLQFCVSDYAQGGLVDYTYRMEGMDGQWYQIGGEMDVTFHDVSPGTYVFQVKARPMNGSWDEAHVASVRIVVSPPFWRSGYAWAVYVALVLWAVWLVVRFYKRKLLLENSLVLEKERIRFYTNITHELRTPLTLILGPLEDLAGDTRIPASYTRKIKMIYENAVRLLSLINQLLDFRKTEMQGRKLTVAKGNIENLVAEIGLRYKELNRNAEVKLRIETESMPPLYYDTEVVTTILNNLLSNALKYTPKGQICLSAHPVDKGKCRYVDIRVTDTGYGIEPQALPHIFEPYYQAQGRHQASGTGIGLALVKSLATLHKGVLDVESEPGKGASFLFRLDREETYPEALHKDTEEEELTVRPDEDEEEPVADARPAILVVEDNADIRDYIAASLEADYKVLTARNGKEGLELAINHIPNLIVSDVMMPEMDGIHLCKSVKENICTSHIPVVLLTAKDSMQDKEDGYESGADSYLTKPFSARLLKSRIANLLESRRKLSERLLAGAVADGGQVSSNTVDKVTQEVQLSRLDKEFMDKLVQLIEENLSQEKLDIAFMTDRMHMSHSAFYRKVKALTGLTANEFIRKVKLKKCALLLRSGDYNVTEAALMAGFNNMGYFRECFKEEFGMSPSEYIKRWK